MSNKFPNIAFILGCSRSGTNALGDVLDSHSQMKYWFEPYFVWDRYFRDAKDDVRLAKHYTPEVANSIKKEFSRFQKRFQCDLVLDKSPRNSLKIPFIRKMFPEAKIIHVVRDGRDVIASINREWLQRVNVYGEQKANVDYKKAFSILMKWLKKQPAWDYRIRAFWHETHGHLVNKSKHTNRMRWDWKIGFGPQFSDWRKTLQECSLLQFNAYQWLNCIKSVQNEWRIIPANQRLEIYFEDLLKDPKDVIGNVLEFLGYDDRGKYLDLSVLRRDNHGKWKQNLNSEQLAEISQIITDMLVRLGYETNDNWLDEYLRTHQNL
jgi:hypothetical protein